MKPTTHENLTITPSRKRNATLPSAFVGALSLFEISAVENDSRTYLAPDDDCPRSFRVPMLCVQLGGDSELVARSAALLLLQSGGRAFIQPSKNFGGSLALVYLPHGCFVEIR